MADHSSIEWTDATWNPVTGCSVVSPGCADCYAMRLAGTRLRHHPSRAGLTRDSKAGPVWTGEVRLNEQWLTHPLQWKRSRKIVVCAHGDLFHESVPDAWIDQVFAVMALAPQHTFQVLTKRSARMRAYFNGPWPNLDGVAARVADATWAIAPSRQTLPNPPTICEVPVGPCLQSGDPEFGWRRMMRVNAWPLPNVWLGVSAEDQRRADERVPDLLSTPAAVRFVSAEPLLGPIDFTRIACPTGCYPPEYCNRCHPDGGTPTGTIDALMAGAIDQIIVGGENGDRPMHPAWARAIRDQCAGEAVAFFFKQWGSWAVEHPRAGGDLGGDVRRGVVRHVCADRENDGHFRRGDIYMRRVGKGRAGRLLDGVEHSGMPERAA